MDAVFEALRGVCASGLEHSEGGREMGHFLTARMEHITTRLSDKKATVEDYIILPGQNNFPLVQCVRLLRVKVDA